MHWTQNISPPLAEDTITDAYLRFDYYNAEEDFQGNIIGFKFYADCYQSKTYYDTEIAAGRVPETTQRGKVPFDYTDHWYAKEVRQTSPDGDFYWESIPTLQTDYTDHFPGIDTLDEFGDVLVIDYGATILP